VLSCSCVVRFDSGWFYEEGGGGGGVQLSKREVKTQMTKLKTLSKLPNRVCEEVKIELSNEKTHEIITRSMNKPQVQICSTKKFRFSLVNFGPQEVDQFAEKSKRGCQNCRRVCVGVKS